MKNKPLIIVVALISPILIGCTGLFKNIDQWNAKANPSENYYHSKELSLKNAENHISDVDNLFDYLATSDGTNGSDKYAKARTLMNAWTNLNSNSNPFSESYSGS